MLEKPISVLFFNFQSVCNIQVSIQILSHSQVFSALILLSSRKRELSLFSIQACDNESMPII